MEFSCVYADEEQNRRDVGNTPQNLSLGHGVLRLRRLFRRWPRGGAAAPRYCAECGSLGLGEADSPACAGLGLGSALLPGKSLSRNGYSSPKPRRELP